MFYYLFSGDKRFLKNIEDYRHHDFEKNAIEYLASDVYIFDIFANFGPKFSGHIKH